MSSAHEHEKLFKEVEALIREALQQVDPAAELPLTACYLGNWLSDYSQIIDPVRFVQIHEGLGDIVDMLNEVFDDLIGDFEQFITRDAYNFANDVLDEIDDVLETLFGQAKRTIRDFADDLDGLDDVLGAGDEIAWATNNVTYLIDYLDSNVDGTIHATKREVLEFRAAVRREIRRGRDWLRAQRDLLIARLQRFFAGGRSSELADALRALIRFFGYLKFVAGKGMVPKLYFSVFDEICNANERRSQYYPHLHHDRPDYVVEGPSGAEPKGPRNAHEAGTADRWYLYPYLRDNIEVLAGDFAGLDLDWSQRSFRSATDYELETCQVDLQSELADDLSWHVSLARLGQCLHLVEDYFAHTNFVDLALPMLEGHAKVDSKVRAETVRLRALRWTAAYGAGQVSDACLEPEDLVVSGLYDGRDMLVSILHILDHKISEWRGLSHTTLAQDADSVLEYDYRKAFEDALEFIADPRGVYARDKDNVIVEQLSGLAEDVEQTIASLEGRDERAARVVNMLFGPGGLMEDIDPQAQADAKQVIDYLFRGATAVGLGEDIYTTVKSVVTFFANPGQYLRDQLEGAGLRLLGRFVHDFLRQSVFDLAGGKRVGHHALLAKDDPSSFLFEDARRCAIAVDRYVCKTLLRRPEVRTVMMCRTADQTEDKNRVEIHKWFDWHEILEHFLTHPEASLTDAQAEDVEVPTACIHRTVPYPGSIASSDTLAHLAAQYNESRYGDAPLTWREIADANYGTAGLAEPDAMLKIYRQLLDCSQGVPLDHGRVVAFLPNVEVVIPRQRTTISVVRKWSVPPWWKPVILGRDNSDDWQLGHVPNLMQKTELEQLIECGEELRTRLEQKYDPS